MDKEELKERTKEFALRVIQLVESLPRERTVDVIRRPRITPKDGIEKLFDEADQIVAMTVSSIKTARRNRR